MDCAEEAKKVKMDLDEKCFNQTFNEKINHSCSSSTFHRYLISLTD